MKRLGLVATAVALVGYSSSPQYTVGAGEVAVGQPETYALRVDTDPQPWCVVGKDVFDSVKVGDTIPKGAVDECVSKARVEAESGTLRLHDVYLIESYGLNNSYVVSVGKGKSVSCPVPKELFDNSYPGQVIAVAPIRECVERGIERYNARSS